QDASAQIQEEVFIAVQGLRDSLQPPGHTARDVLQHVVRHSLDQWGNKSPRAQYPPFFAPGLQGLAPARGGPLPFAGEITQRKSAMKKASATGLTPRVLVEGTLRRLRSFQPSDQFTPLARRKVDVTTVFKVGVACTAHPVGELIAFVVRKLPFRVC